MTSFPFRLFSIQNLRRLYISRPSTVVSYLPYITDAYKVTVSKGQYSIDILSNSKREEGKSPTAYPVILVT